MREYLIKDINDFLEGYDGIFLSEKEIQVKLAKYLETREYDNVFLEYYVNKAENIKDYPWENDKKIFIDIVVRKENDYIPIEIKFRTSNQTFEYNVFGSNKQVELGEQIAQNEGMYYFWKDVKRVELFESEFNLKYSGIVLFITNDKKYLQKPRPTSKYAPFSTENDKVIEKNSILNWNGNISPKRASKFPGFILCKNYKIEWKSMNIEDHHYILL